MKYYDMLIERNKVMNLTAITEFEEVINKHFIDSLSIIKVYQTLENSNVLDMGTGAGFPGIPLKIAFPSINITLLDSLNKRVGFLNDVIQALDLNQITAIHGRAEDFGKNPAYREKFDLCVSRAVAKLSSLSEYCMPYVKINGYFIPYKSGNIEDELEEAKKAIKIFGGTIEAVVKFNLPGTDLERSFIVIKKVAITPKLYPRSAGKPTKEPIK
jgi:16S rRNA (guanine527-N7)-methyltransferase